MSNTQLAELKDEAHRLIDSVKTLAEQVKSENRDFSDQENRWVQDSFAEVRRLKEEIKQKQEEADLTKSLEALGTSVDLLPAYGEPGSEHMAPPGQPRSRHKGRGGRMGDVWSQRVNAVFGQKGLTTSGTLNVPSPVLDPVRDPERPRYVADLIPSEPVTGSVAPYIRQTTRTNQAAAVTGGATKPESTYGIERVEAKITTIAHLVDDVKRQDLADAAYLSEFIRAEMLLGLREEVDDQILNGSGLGANLEGLLISSGVQSQAWSTDLLTTLRKARTKLQLEDFEPTGLVMHPNDSEDLDLLKDAELRYYFSGPGGSGASPVWSTPVVVTSAIADGVALMGDFRNAVIFSREEARIDFTEALGFKQNTVTFRAELRMGFGILRPLAFVEVDLTP